jgi:RNA polymerase sigma factor (sigma-70 family)
VEQGASADLRARLAAGEEGAIEECYALLGPMVLGYLRRFVPRDDAEDVLQRVFYEVWKNRDRYDPARSLEAWVLGIARKRAIDQLRRRHATIVPIEELRDIAGDDGRELAERYARASEVRGALERLSAEQREVRRPHPDRDRRPARGAAGHGQGAGLPRPAPPGRHPGHGGLSRDRAASPGRPPRAAARGAAPGHGRGRRPPPDRLRSLPPRPGRGGRRLIGPA